MTAIAQNTTNALLALTIPVLGVAFLLSGQAMTARTFAGAFVALAVVLATAGVAVNTATPGGLRVAAADVPAHAPSPRGHVMDVSRSDAPRHWTAALLIPVQLLAVVWGAPLAIALALVPIGLVLAGLLRVVRMWL